MSGLLLVTVLPTRLETQRTLDARILHPTDHSSSINPIPGNTLGTVSSVIGPKITAWTLIQTDQNWNIVLGTVCFVNLLAAFNYSRCAVVTPLEQLVGEGKAE